MKATSSGSQIGWGIALGILLQPLSVLLTVGIVIAMTKAGENRGWGVMGAVLGYSGSFGMAQILTILPAALLLLATGKHGVVRGLLAVGTLLAIANVALLVFAYMTNWRQFLNRY